MSSSSKLKIALAQTCPVLAPESVNPPNRNPFAVLEQNLINAREQVEAAAAQHADIIVFPEYFLQGLVNSGRQFLTYPSRHLTSFLSDLAREHNISIVGTIVHAVYSDSPPSDLPKASPFDHISCRGTEPSGEGRGTTEWEDYVGRHPAKNHEPLLENTAFYIERGSGEVIGEYAKRNLWHPEREYLAPGSESHAVFQTKWGRCGLIICWDVSHPAAGQALADLGVDIVFAPTYWIGYDSAPMIHKHHLHPPAYERELLSALTYARCFETETAWVLCNAGGTGPEGYIGGSGVWMPLKGKVEGCETEAELVVVDVDLGVLKDARELYKIREDWSKREAT